LSIPFFARKTKPGNPEFSLLRNGDERLWCARKLSGIALEMLMNPGFQNFASFTEQKRGSFLWL
jgi:hypothetical protein